MNFNISFVITSIMMGVGLAMDAFSVSMANGLNEPDMKARKMLLIAGVLVGFRRLCRLSVGCACIR